MKTQYSIQGMHCDGCATKIAGALQKVPGVKSASVGLAAKSAVIDSDSEIPFSMLSQAVAALGKYVLSEKQEAQTNGSVAAFVAKARTYLPLIVAFGLVTCWTLFRRIALGWDLHSAMHDFMGAFFLIFGGLKVLNWRGFAESYRAYDPLAIKSRLYAYLYPAIELYLGIGYQFRFQNAFFQEIILNTLTVMILGVATVGVLKALKQRQRIQCACLGGFFSIPITWFTVFENVLMIIMAIYMQIVFGKV